MTFSHHFPPAALPAGSPFFVGRTEEIKSIKDGIEHESFLIAGARRSGKTSLLNHLRREWRLGDVTAAPIFVDLDNKIERQQTFNYMATEFSRKFKEGIVCDFDSLRASMENVRRNNFLPVFLFNEIDYLLQRDPKLFILFRDFHRRGLARFIFTGHQLVDGLGLAHSIFNRFTKGYHFNRTTIFLTAFSDDDCHKIIDKIPDAEPHLSWHNDEVRRKARDELAKRSYGLPWALRSLMRTLVVTITSSGRAIIEADDLRQALSGCGHLVGSHVLSFDYTRLGIRTNLGQGLNLLLLALARQIYFTGGSPILDPHLRCSDALDARLIFDSTTAYNAIDDIIEACPDNKHRALIGTWFQEIDLDKHLRILTLTSILEPGRGTTAQYAFHRHILPNELQRRHGLESPNLDDLLEKRTMDLVESLDSSKEN